MFLYSDVQMRPCSDDYHMQLITRWATGMTNQINSLLGYPANLCQRDGGGTGTRCTTLAPFLLGRSWILIYFSDHGNLIP